MCHSRNCSTRSKPFCIQQGQAQLLKISSTIFQRDSSILLGSLASLRLIGLDTRNSISINTVDLTWEMPVPLWASVFTSTTWECLFQPVGLLCALSELRQCWCWEKILCMENWVVLAIIRALDFSDTWLFAFEEIGQVWLRTTLWGTWEHGQLTTQDLALALETKRFYLYR